VGLRQVRGLSEETGRRIEEERGKHAFASVEDLIARAALDKREVESLARAGALSAFGLSRREAIWKVRAPREHSLLSGIELGDERPRLPSMTRAEQLVLDYAYTGVSVDDHPMKILRSKLPPHIKSARALESIPHGARVSAGGMVICRQRPGTASGVVFVTLEDEEGFINLILWAKTFERFRHVATTSSMLLAHGKVERQGQVIYVVPTYLEPLVAPAETSSTGMPTMSRDFH
jgi:DNA polymerase III alpha subunit